MDAVAWRVWDRVLMKYVNGTFMEPRRAERQLGRLLASGKYPGDRFVIAGLDADGREVTQFTGIEPPETELL